MKRRVRLSFNAPVTLSFVIIAFLVTLVGIMTGQEITRSFFMTYHSSLRSPMTYIRFFTHVLGHSGWDHFIGNTCYILLLGPMLEEKYGSRALVEVMALTALITAVINYVFFPSVALCGASGIVFAFILLSSFTGFREGEIPLTFILVAVVYLGQQVYDGIFVQDNISNLAHITGGVIGSVLGYIFNKK
ncbi:MAG: rhomboid family intramembrane serine protease [Clostridia bacterium]|nr:rhomboid family intramembrane serine protease [Clostridia bacterium]